MGRGRLRLSIRCHGPCQRCLVQVAFRPVLPNALIHQEALQALSKDTEAKAVRGRRGQGGGVLGLPIMQDSPVPGAARGVSLQQPWMSPKHQTLSGQRVGRAGP